MNCKEARLLIEDAVDGTLADGARRGFERHVRDCAECRAILESAEAEFVRWRSALRDGVRGRTLPADFADRLVRAVEENASKRRAFWSLGKAPALKVAAALAVLLGVAGIVFSAGRTSEPDVLVRASIVPSNAATDLGSRCERITQMLMTEVSYSAAAQYMADMCWARGI
jgi:anti-sigma factor RsiW